MNAASYIGEVARLRGENERLKARVAELEAALRGCAFHVPDGLKLRPRGAEILQLLLARPLVSHEAIMAVLYAGRIVGDDTVKVHICHLLAALRPHGIEILTHIRQGYALAPEGRARLRALMAADGKGRLAA